MGQRLVLPVQKNNQTLFVLYQHWGAYTDNEAEVMCYLLSVLNKNDSLETLLKKTTQVLEGSGLIIPKDPEELKIVQQYLDKGLPAASDRNDGLIAITPKEMDELIDWADDTLPLLLDGTNCFSDLLYYTEDPDEYRDGDNPIPSLPDFFNTNITKKNAMALLSQFKLNYSDIYVDSAGNYLTTLTC